MKNPFPDLWTRLQCEGRDVVLYGMGDGADKILRVCAGRGIPVRDVFASDAFVRGQHFHGRRVLRWAEVCQRYDPGRLTVLLAFATSLPGVLRDIRAVAAAAPLYVPDVPVCGEELFDAAFVQAHREELAAARALLCDGESRRIFDRVVQGRLTGDPELLLAARSDPAAAMRELVCPAGLRGAADLGAYTGDTARGLLDAGARPEFLLAMEPDAHSFRRLAAWAAAESRTRVLPAQAAAWDREETLDFAAGGRGAAVRPEELPAGRTHRRVPTPTLPPDSLLQGRQVDYIKFDVEGAEAQALAGSAGCIRRCLPTLQVSLYHRSGDLFALPLLIHRLFPAYRGLYLRRFGGLPAWDINLYVRKETTDAEADHPLLS